jgi:hypothetical protein
MSTGPKAADESLGGVTEEEPDRSVLDWAMGSTGPGRSPLQTSSAG